MEENLQTCDDLKLVDITDLRAMSECLTTNPSIRQRPSDCKMEVVRPRFRSQTMFQALMQHVDPQLSSWGINIRRFPLMHLHFLAAERFHIDHEPLRRLRLSHEGVAVASSGHGQARGRTHLPHVLHGDGDVGDFLGVEDCPREEMELVAEIPCCEFIALEAEMAVELDCQERRRWEGREGEGEFDKHAA